MTDTPKLTSVPTAPTSLPPLSTVQPDPPRGGADQGTLAAIISRGQQIAQREQEQVASDQLATTLYSQTQGREAWQIAGLRVKAETARSEGNQNFLLRCGGTVGLGALFLHTMTGKSTPAKVGAGIAFALWIAYAMKDPQP